MALTVAQLAARDGRLTASRVACLMTGNAEAIFALWREMLGDPEYPPEDLSGVWAVQLGSATEALNLDWYERKTGRPLSRRGEMAVHPEAEWAAATLDAWDDGLPGPVEAKHVGGREPLQTVIDRYQPQLHWQMIVTGVSQAALSVIEGAREPVIEVIDRDQDYAAELWRRASGFMRCVWSLTPPVALPTAAAPVRAERTYDFTGRNEWAAYAAAWLETWQAGKKAIAAEKALKTLVPHDAAKCHGHGVVISRNRAGHLSLREDTNG